MDDSPHIIRTKEIPWTPLKEGTRFEYLRKRMSLGAGGKEIGCSIFRVPPGKSAFPAHRHFHNEEAYYILEGEGILRYGEKRVPITAGDYVALPARGPAHQLIGGEANELVYLCISTNFGIEIAEYPDSKKIGVLVEGQGTSDPKAREFFKLFREGDEVGYYDGE